MRYWIAIILLVVAALPAFADDFYVRNKPFKGPVAGSGDRIEAGLEALVEAVGLKVESVEGGFYVGWPDGGSEEARRLVTGPGVVVVGSQAIPGRVDAAGVVFVPVKDFARALDLRFTVNPQMATVDLSIPGSWGKPKSTAPPAAAASAGYPARGPIPPIVVPTNHGQSVVAIKDYVVRGRYNFVYFHVPTDSICKETMPFVKSFAARNDDVAVLLVDVGSVKSPMAKAFNIPRVPVVRTTLPNGVFVGTGGMGHGVKSSFESDGFLNQLRDTWKRMTGG